MRAFSNRLVFFAKKGKQDFEANIEIKNDSHFLAIDSIALDQAPEMAKPFQFSTRTVMIPFFITANARSELLLQAIDVWMGVCTAFVFAALVEFTFVNYLWRRKQGPRQPGYGYYGGHYGKSISGDIVNGTRQQNESTPGAEAVELNLVRTKKYSD